MINKPGTLLVVRKHSRKKKNRFLGSEFNGIEFVFFEDKLAKNNDDAFYYPTSYVSLPYGATVMLLSIEKVEKARFHGEHNRRRVTVLFGEKKLVGSMSENQLNKWFTFPRVWEKYYKNKPKEDK